MPADPFQPTILTVDPDTSALFSLAELLLENNIRPLTARTYEIGMMLAFNESVDLLVVNARLDKSSGYEFIQQVRSHYPEQFLPAVVLDAHQSTAVIHRSDCLMFRKPVKQQILLQFINQIMAAKAHRRKFEQQGNAPVPSYPSTIPSPKFSVLRAAPWSV